MAPKKLKSKDLPEHKPGTSLTDWLLECILSHKGSKDYQVGVHILLSGGAKMIPLLMENALNPDRKPRHRVRLLDLMLEIGAPLSAVDYSTMTRLLDDRSTKVAEKAHEVLVTLCPDGPPTRLPAEVLQPLNRFFQDSTRQMLNALERPIRARSLR